jgi:hypothetical protein
MKFLKVAIFMIVAMAVSGSRAQEGGFDHEQLTTTDGRTYHEIYVIGSDANGLTFRHRQGIAKVGFGQLSDAYRMLYEAVADLPEAAPGAPMAESAEGPATEADWVETLDEQPVVLLARNRAVIEWPAPRRWLGGGLDPEWLARSWPVWWPDHARVHRITHPLYREQVLREFLHLSGLLPCPGGW